MNGANPDEDDVNDVEVLYTEVTTKMRLLSIGWRCEKCQSRYDQERSAVKLFREALLRIEARRTGEG